MSASTMEVSRIIRLEAVSVLFGVLSQDNRQYPFEFYQISLADCPVLHPLLLTVVVARTGLQIGVLTWSDHY